MKPFALLWCQSIKIDFFCPLYASPDLQSDQIRRDCKKMCERSLPINHLKANDGRQIRRKSYEIPPLAGLTLIATLSYDAL